MSQDNSAKSTRHARVLVSRLLTSARMHSTFAFLFVGLGATPASAGMQDLVVMRRVIAAPNPVPTPTPTVSPTPITGGTWEEGVWKADAACGATTERRTPQCMIGGVAVPASACAMSIPPSSRPATDYSTCTYRWTSSEWTPWSTGCGQKSSRTRTIACHRSDGQDTYITTCKSILPGPMPEELEYEDVIRACTWSWKPAGLGPWANTCSDNTTRPVLYKCMRSDGIEDAGKCVGNAPVSNSTGSNYDGCQDALIGGNFDVATPKWIKDPTVTHATAMDGRRVLQIATPSNISATGTYQIAAGLTLDATYRVSVEVMRTSSQCGKILLRATPSGSGTVASEVTLPCASGEWQTISVDFKATRNAATILILSSRPDEGGNHIAIFDNAKVVRVR